MFGSFPTLANLQSQARVGPDDVPLPTPICLPRYQPYAHEDQIINPSESLPHLLKQAGLSAAALGPPGFSAIGLDLKLDVALHDMVPDASHVPDFNRWHGLSPDQARAENEATRQRLRNGNLSPGCQIYLERKAELSHANEDAFRTIRRQSLPKGKQRARLGNAFEFFRCLEFFTTYWDDPTRPPQLPPSPELSIAETAGHESRLVNESNNDDSSVTERTSCGQLMPPEFRQTLIAAFVKLVAYDFGCNVSMSRVEPRLHLTSPPGPQQRKTYTPSNCHFIFQSPQSRETARAGLVYGPVAAVSARSTVNFTTPDVETAQSLDLAREVTAALITAQHRAREGKTESRFGQGQWWTSAPRWGGGSGGPIGREIDKCSVQGDEKATLLESGLTMAAAKKPRRNMSIYDNYRMVRPPSSTWDRKTQYEAIGKVEGAAYDDVYVISSLFHHVSVLRVRVPLRLLDVLDGAPEPKATERSWGTVQAWRSPWYDLFEKDGRVTAMQLLWVVMAFQTRGKMEADGGGNTRRAAGKK